MALRPTRPTAPPQALRSNPATFSANAEASISYQWTALPDWIEGMGDYVSTRADEATAAALAGDLPPLTGQAGRFLRVNSSGTAAEFYALPGIGTTTSQLVTDYDAITVGGTYQSGNQILVHYPGPNADNAYQELFDRSTGGKASRFKVNGAWESFTFSRDTPAGAVMYFAMSTAPAGWIKCAGSTISRTAYNRLFNAIGTTFGAGDGSTTFSLPDLRGEFIRGWDDGRGADPSRAFGSGQTDAFRSHRHDYALPVSGGTGAGLDGYDGGGDSSYAINPTENAGGTETRPRNIALLPCIKY